jgi:type IV secretory pathway component VirB8
VENEFEDIVKKLDSSQTEEEVTNSMCWHYAYRLFGISSIKKGAT